MLTCFLRILGGIGGPVDARVEGIVTRPSGAGPPSTLKTIRRSVKPCEPDNQGPAVPPIRQSDYEHLTRIGKRSYHIEPYAEQQNTEAPCTEEDPAHCKHLGRGVGMEPSTPPTPRPLFSPPSSTPPDQSKIETWLRRCQDNGQPVHICILLESHWGFESEWATQDYHALHTGLNRKQGGTRVLIHKTFIASQGIRLATVVPGRLLQIRLDTEPAITVLAVYQAVWNDGAKQEDSRTQREQLWSRLFNTPCLPQPPFVGPSVLADPTKVKQKDQHRLQQLISMHNLVALNTWGRCKHSHTYQFDAPNITRRTQIDFLLFRAQQTDGLAKSARAITAPFVPTNGMRHHPLLASLPLPAAPRTNCTSLPKMSQQVSVMTLHWLPGSRTKFSSSSGYQRQETQPLLSIKHSYALGSAQTSRSGPFRRTLWPPALLERSVSLRRLAGTRKERE